VGCVTIKRERRNSYRFLVGKPERKRKYLGPRCWWEDNIEVDLT